MSKKAKIDNKQNKKPMKKLSNENKKRFGIIVFTCSIILLLLILVGILKINTKVKSEPNKIMSKYYEYYKSDKSKIILYYSSKDDENNYSLIELEYLKQLSKDYKIDYLAIDNSLLNDKNKKTIENDLGIEEYFPTIIIVKNQQVIGLHNGFVESHNLVKLLIDVNILEKDAKYSQIDNLKFIDYKKYKKLLDSKETNVIVVGQAGCQYCKAIKPILNNISKAYKIDINYLDINDLEKLDIQEFFEELPDLGYDDASFKEEGTFSMPTLMIVKKGKITSFLQEQKTLEEYISYLKENDIIE